MKKSVIITAGGSGKRMQSDVPKQFLNLAGKPILMHTIEKFYAADSNFELIVTLPESERWRWNELCGVHHFSIRHKIIPGGESRIESVRNALEFCTGDLIAVHDGVRPFVQADVILNCFQTASEKGTAVPVVPIDQSIRKISGTHSELRNRSNYKLVQTPQVFRREILLAAYADTEKAEFSDDAGLVESCGNTIYLVDGNRENIKITTPFDLKIATLLVE